MLLRDVMPALNMPTYSLQYVVAKVPKLVRVMVPAHLLLLKALATTRCIHVIERAFHCTLELLSSIEREYECANMVMAINS